MTETTNILNLIGRERALFTEDIASHEEGMAKIIQSASFLVIGAAGSIGQAVTKEIFKRNPALLHCLDINENNLVELVRDIRSSLGYIKGDFRTFVIDTGSFEFESLIKSEHEYDYVLNLSALKHVRSESDPYSLMRMVEVNIINTVKSLNFLKDTPIKKYFCVSTDKAANPVNMMGASKRIMEMFLIRHNEEVNISTARFANVAFSDGSLLDGFNYRFSKKQPLAAPSDIKRYFVTPQESGELCLMSCLYGKNMDIFFPKLDEELHLVEFSEIAKRYLLSKGYTPYLCQNEDEARKDIDSYIKKKKWPCYFEKSNTTGEKSFEEFFTDKEALDLKSYEDIGIVKNTNSIDAAVLDDFFDTILLLQSSMKWTKEDILDAFKKCLPDLDHVEKSWYLDEKM